MDDKGEELKAKMTELDIEIDRYNSNTDNDAITKPTFDTDLVNENSSNTEDLLYI